MASSIPSIDRETESRAGKSAASEAIDIRLQLEALLKATGAAAFTFDRKGKILSCNDGAERLFGYVVAAAMELPIDKILPRLHSAKKTSAAMTGTAPAWLCAYYPAESPEPAFGRHRDGHLFPVDPIFVTWLSESGEKRAGVILSDATERHQAEEESRRNQTHLADAQRIGGIGSWDWNIEVGEIKLSDAMCEMLGIPPGARRTPADAMGIIHSEDRGLWRAEMDRMIAGESVPGITYRTVQKDGTVRVFVSTGKLVRHSDGPHLIGVVKDITEQSAMEAERRQQEETLRRNEMHLAEAQRIGGVGSFDLDIGTSEFSLSAEMTSMFGLPPGARSTLASATASVHLDDRAAFQEALGRMAAGEQVPPITSRMNWPDGTPRVLQTSGQRIQYADGPHLVGAVRDVTELTRLEVERGQREEELRRSQMHLAEAQRIGGIGSWDLYVPTGEFNLSDEMRKLIKIGPNGRRTKADSLAQIHVDDRAAWTGAIDRMSAGEEVPPLEFRMNLADNSIRRYQISGQLVQYSNGPHVVGVSKDVTEERQREAERRETEKLAALGHLAGGVAHEINNLLLPVISLSELVQEDLAGMPDRVLADEMSENLTMVMNCGRQARDIVRKILRYSRHEIPNLSLTDLVATVNSAVELVRELLSPGVKLTVEFALEVAGMARMDGSEMTQVVMNLAVNADHAMNGQGDLRLRLEKVRLSKSVARSKLVEPGEYFLLRVADTGAGMDAATQARIFDPFFTTKPVGQGTGLGLSMVQGIMKSWNGTIAVSSEIGKGTEFRLYIPVITGASEQADAGSPAA